VRELLQDLADDGQARFCELRAVRGCGNAATAPVAIRSEVAEETALAASIAPLAPSERCAHVESAVLRVVRELTGAAAAALTSATPLMEAGVDSLAATELASRLRSITGVAVSPTIVFEQPTSRAVAAHLLEHVTPSASAAPLVAPTAARVSDGRPSLALIGMVGRWPGGCNGDGPRAVGALGARGGGGREHAELRAGGVRAARRLCRWRGAL
jgi:aryl carrier-like protein